ncbi:receptor-type tyrosine-protein phosphatase gamma-like [Scomber japonicus]|uniref:receptor-type tyrosine-protein phosphatase gamma-like n=1 Tax=Scomber japonicus TaxID=13676 RepID=UPI002305C055|nr:receptor-type tyrosine-protein phosphatase gamma-like [Scomber japonicus]
MVLRAPILFIDHTPSHWSSLNDSFCGNKKRQSPIDIVTSHVLTDHNLVNFTFLNFSSPHVFKTIENNGHTVKCNLVKNEVEVSGGGLSETYSTLQLHFHWGDTEHHPGSEHLIDGHRYPMEMHIVSLKKGLTVEEAKADPEGIAVLGFFINATDDGDMSEPWSNLTSYLMNKTGKDPAVNITDNISINDLIKNVDLTKFYRYMGSLTTPTCNEAVVWTVFQEPINIHKNLTQLFPMKTGLNNVFRPSQIRNGRQVFASPATPLPHSPWCYDDHHDDHCEYSSLKWHELPQSHCGKKSQSPIDIETKEAMTDKHLNNFTFTKFDDKHTIKYITNTGHSVKCVLEEDMVEVSGGGLGHVYSTLQFHFHWGSESHGSGGSEHTVDTKRYPMEMHIVNKRKDLTLEDAIKTQNGLAVLGFFIEAPHASKNSGGSDHDETNPTSTTTSNMEPWKTLTNYLSKINNTKSKVDFTEKISIDDLLGNVDRTAYFRYNGSLTTPSCNEAVVWTVFKESVKVDQNLMMMFPSQTKNHNVYRPVQSLNGRKVYTTAGSSVHGPIIRFLLLACLCHFFL